MKKVVIALGLDYLDEKIKTKLMKRISSLGGVESILIGDDRRMTLTGNIDPALAVKKLRKLCNPTIVSVGPKEEEKKKEEGGKKDEEKKKEDEKNVPATYDHCHCQYPPPSPYYQVIPVMEESPRINCVIC